MTQNDLLLGGDGTQQAIQLANMSNRHGLIAGATGTGKTVTLQVLAENFARAGVPVFAVDAKADLSGIAKPGNAHEEVDRRNNLVGRTDYTQRQYATLHWDVFGERGHPVRTTVSEMGPDILAALLDLNDTQSGVLYACFAIADDQGMLLLDLKDLRSLLTFMTDNAKELRQDYGNISSASVGAIQRRLLVLEQQGGESFFGEPALQLSDLMLKDFSGHGVISLLDGERLLRDSPNLYAAFVLWLISELFEELPEAGDLDKPKLVVFFDEAHLLFKNMPKGLLDKVEQVFRLIRSKAVGIYLVTQSPTDIPDAILGQLGMKVQHALRAFTPKDQKTIRGVVQGLRNDSGMDVAETLTSLGVGEALISTLDQSGTPCSVIAATIAPPESRIGPLTDAERTANLANSPIGTRYDEVIDRESAYELLQQKAQENARLLEAEERAQAEAREREKEAKARQRKPRGRSRQGIGEAMLKSAARSVGRSLGSKLVRGLLGSLLK
ncbi:MAG: helicase HerA-like domain-containing protein [Pseudomonadota bacterium]